MLDRREFLTLTVLGALRSGISGVNGRLPHDGNATGSLLSRKPAAQGARLRDINSTDLRSAIVMGLNPMQNVFNADDDDIPYFLLVARPIARLGFVPNLSEAFIPGLHLAALLRSEEAVGVAADEDAVRKHTRALMFAHSGPLPLPLNRQELGGPLTHFLPSNLKSSFAGFAALIGRRQSSAARDLAEATLGAVLELWQPARGWDTRRLQREWGVGFIDLFAKIPAPARPRYPEFAGAIGPLVSYYQLTRSERALTLLTMIPEQAMTEYLPPGGRYDATRLGRNAGNAAGRTITLFRGLMQLAAATGDGALMVRTKEYFDRTLPVFSNDLGWSLDTPATADEDSDCACRVGKAVDLALLVGEAGFAEGYDYAERLMRGYLLPSQLRDPSFFAQPPRDGTGDPFRDVASRALGSWGSPAPYGHHREGNARIMFCTDVVSDVVPALCRAWVDCVRFDAQGHQVNLLFDRSTPEITIRSPYTHDALVLELKQRAPVRVRVPTWLSRRDIEVDGGRALPQLVHGYLYIPEPVSTTLTIRFPLVRRELVRTYRGKPLHVRLAGDKVLQMDNRGMDATFFDPIAS